MANTDSTQNNTSVFNKLGEAFKKQWEQVASTFSSLLSAETVVSKIISETTEALSELKEVDTYLTNISKTSRSFTASDLKQLGKNALSTASDYGKSATDYLSGVQDMLLAGYKNAEAMTELSMAAQTAGNMTADVANKMVTATDEAYKMSGSVKELTEVLDGVNWICDNNALDMTELSEAMTIAGSTAASSGVAVNELAAALGTMTSATRESGSEVADAFQTILLHIKQVTDEEEGIDAEGLKKYEKACKALGVSLKETVNGVLQSRDAMDVLEELSEAYSKLGDNDIRKTNLLSSVGDKATGTQLDALLSQWDTYEEMLKQYADGTGTMATDAEKTVDSWEGSLKKLSNTWTETVENIANSKAIVTIVNGLNEVVTGINKLTDSFGALGTIGLSAGLFAGIKNVGRDKMCSLVLNMPTMIVFSGIPEFSYYQM